MPENPDLMDLEAPGREAPGTILDLAISSVAYGGKGVARVGDGRGKVWFVADAVEGDRVRARVEEDQGRYGEASLVELVTPSPHRGPSPCPYSGTCGGCNWQGVAYETQLAWKRSFVKSALTRIGKLGLVGDDWPIHPSPNPQGYRNRIFMRARIDDDGKVVAGYFMRGSRTLVPVARCAIADPAINAFLARFQKTRFAVPAQPLRLEIQALPALGSEAVTVTIFPEHPDSPGTAELTRATSALAGVVWAGTVFDARAAEFKVLEPAGADGIAYHTAPGLFQQVNLRANAILRREVRRIAEALNPLSILDLFCGSGNLSLGLADGTRYVEGIEFDERAIKAARHNAEKAGRTNVNYLAGDAERHLWKVSKKGERFDLVLADPPRQGMYKACIPLKNLAPKHILYVSCDPTTLARDLAALCRKDRYRLKEIQAFDFFPNTYHVETMVLLERAD